MTEVTGGGGGGDEDDQGQGLLIFPSKQAQICSYLAKWFSDLFCILQTCLHVASNVKVFPQFNLLHDALCMRQIAGNVRN